jgi:hypothetical protein
MKAFIVAFLLIVVIGACKTKPNQARSPHKSVLKVSPESSPHTKIIFSVGQPDSVHNDIYDESAIYYIVIADTGNNYYELKDKMQNIHQALNIAIDTMGRYYNKTKDLIALPDTDSDEIYAGDYFPRRYPTNFLSLEYLNFYHRRSSTSMIALVTGIYENKSSADSALKILRPVQNTAFALRSSVYVGCMH